MVQAGIADYRARSSNVGRLGPFDDPLPPDLEEDVRVLPIIINDLLGSAFSLVNQVISAGNLLTSLQLGTLGSGTGGGFDLNSLLQQFLEGGAYFFYEGFGVGCFFHGFADDYVAVEGNEQGGTSGEGAAESVEDYGGDGGVFAGVDEVVQAAFDRAHFFGVATAAFWEDD